MDRKFSILNDFDWLAPQIKTTKQYKQLISFGRT